MACGRRACLGGHGHEAYAGALDGRGVGLEMDLRTALGVLGVSCCSLLRLSY